MEDETISITRPQSNPVVQNKFNNEPKKESKYPTEIIELPSEGRFYSIDSVLSSGEVELKMMTAREEDILTNQNFIRKGTVLDKLLESLIVDKRVNINDLLIGDKNAIFFAARRLAYGDDYGPLEIKCPSCRESNKITVNLGELGYKKIELSDFDKGVNEFSYVLPFSKVNITYKLITSGDESSVDAEMKALQKIKSTNTSSEVTTRMKRIIVSVNGDTDKKVINKFVDEMPSRDSIELRKHVKGHTPDVDNNFNFVCEHCNHEERVAVPMTVAFFWPESRG